MSNEQQCSDRAIAQAYREFWRSGNGLPAAPDECDRWIERRAAEIDAAEPAARAALSTPAAAVPEGYVLVPRRLTAENGAKATLIGEFSVDVVHACPDCADEDIYGEDGNVCETCIGEAVVHNTETIPWDTIKRIHDRVVELFAAAPKPQEPQEPRS